MERILISDVTCFERVFSVLETGGVVVVPTDTVYGFSSDALNVRSIERIFRIKKRSQGKPLPIFVNDISMAEEYADIDVATRTILENIWPGALTAVLSSKGAVPRVLESNGTISIRIPQNDFIHSIVAKLSRPITGSSANISGRGPYTDSGEIIAEFEHANEKPDVIVDAGRLPDNIASTIVDFTKRPPVILRKGPILEEAILKFVPYSS